MIQYNDSFFDPPAPLAYVTIRNMPKYKGDRKEWVNVPMLIDSGADVTLLPQKAIEKLTLDVQSDTGYELAGFDNSITTAPLVQAELVFCGRRFRGQYLVIDQDWGILGRNVCNKLAILLDGPNLQWYEWKPH